MMEKNVPCPICSAASSLLDVVDFNKSCEERTGKFLELSGIPIYYACCNHCGFCFAPEITTWKLQEFEEKIYNSEYSLIDPEYVETRPKNNAANLISVFGDTSHSIKHLDYGGGDGLLSNILNAANWQSVSYDPFVNKNVQIEQLGKFDLISAFEVFEHVPHPQHLMANLRSLLSPNGIVLFSTVLSDGNIQKNKRLSWWYASPRNGHISLFSKNSLEILAENNDFNFGSFSQEVHAFYNNIPTWAEHIIRVD